LLKNNGQRNIEVVDIQTDILGPTLASIIWDFDGDQKQELYEGNDSGRTGDILYNITDHEIQLHERMQELVPVSPFGMM
jgi:hypothetical protein